MGTLGIGKSSLMNWIADKECFKVSDQAEGCTQEWNEVTFEEDGNEIILVDTPGTNDPNIPHLQWVNIIQSYAAKNKDRKYGLVLLAL
jgi:small GTP-binding protein